MQDKKTTTQQNQKDPKESGQCRSKKGQHWRLKDQTRQTARTGNKIKSIDDDGKHGSQDVCSPTSQLTQEHRNPLLPARWDCDRIPGLRSWDVFPASQQAC